MFVLFNVCQHRYSLTITHDAANPPHWRATNTRAIGYVAIHAGRFRIDVLYPF